MFKYATLFNIINKNITASFIELKSIEICMGFCKKATTTPGSSCNDICDTSSFANKAECKEICAKFAIPSAYSCTELCENSTGTAEMFTWAMVALAICIIIVFILLFRYYWTHHYHESAYKVNKLDKQELSFGNTPVLELSDSPAHMRGMIVGPHNQYVNAPSRAASEKEYFV